MATTQNTFTGDGSNLGPFSFTFKWLESTDIKVTVAGVLKTAGTHYNLQSLNYSTKTGGQVLFTAGNAPANGAAIVIYRQTDDTDLASTFYSGSAIRAQDLNNNFVQGLYVTQESSNNAAAATAAANAATTTANTALSNSTAAQASAASAISTANSAVSTANSAVSTANSAVSTANSASAAAASAVSTANTANSTASSALSAVSEALAYTTVANVAAIPGSPTNGDSLRITDSTGIESFTPIVGVPVGFVGNSALTVEIYYNGTSSTWVWSRYFPNDPENRYWAGSVVVSDTAPLSPTEDSLWYDSIGGRFYIWYNDGNTSQWVDVSPQGNRTSTFLAGTAALPGLSPEGDSNTGIYSPGADQVAISTNGSERARIDSSGRLLIGTSTARGSYLLQAEGSSDVLFSLARNNNGVFGPGFNFSKSRGTTAGSFTIVNSGDTLGQLGWSGADGTADIQAASITAAVDGTPGANDMPGRLVFSTTADGGSSPTERMRIDSSGRLLVGTSTSTTSGAGFTPGIQVAGSSALAAVSIGRYSADGFQPQLQLQKSRGGIGVQTIVSNNDALGDVSFEGSDGTVFKSAAALRCEVDGTPGTNDMPGRLTFATTADGASSPTERMRIASDGTAYTRGTTSVFSFASNAGAGTTNWLQLGGHSAASITGYTISYAVYTNGNVVNTNGSYTAISDAKLKENIVDANSQWDDIKALQVRNYNFKEGQVHTQIGLVAQEAELVSPGLVSESPDRDEDGNDLGTVTKSVNYSVLYMKAVKALQEAMERIETLEAKVATLEAS